MEDEDPNQKSNENADSSSAHGIQPTDAVSSTGKQDAAASSKAENGKADTSTDKSSASGDASQSNVTASGDASQSKPPASADTTHNNPKQDTAPSDQEKKADVPKESAITADKIDGDKVAKMFNEFAGARQADVNKAIEKACGKKNAETIIEHAKSYQASHESIDVNQQFAPWMKSEEGKQIDKKEAERIIANIIKYYGLKTTR